MNTAHRSICTLLLLSATLSFVTKASSQQTPIKHLIYGKVIDSATGKPLEHAAINFYEQKLLLIKTVITKEDGSFAFWTATSMKEIMIDAFGFNHKTINVSATLNDSLNLDTISLSNKTGNLGGVVVTASKPLIKQEIDKIVYDLASRP
jgi:hypothetical protein